MQDCDVSRLYGVGGLVDFCVVFSATATTTILLQAMTMTFIFIGHLSVLRYL